MRFKVSRETSLHPMETLKYLQSFQLERSVSEVKDEHSKQQRRRNGKNDDSEAEPHLHFKLT
jgi:hypothetical protein